MYVKYTVCMRKHVIKIIDIYKMSDLVWHVLMQGPLSEFDFMCCLIIL